MPTGDPLRLAPAPRRETPGFEPSAALRILDGLIESRPEPKATSAWDAAWIACVTGSPRWAETARQEFACAAARHGMHAV